MRPGKPHVQSAPRPRATVLSKATNWTRSGRLQRLTTRRSTRRCPGLESKMRKDRLDRRRFQDRQDDLQIAAAARAVLQVEIDHALEQLGPAHQLSYSEPAAQQCPLLAGSGPRESPRDGPLDVTLLTFITLGSIKSQATSPQAPATAHRALQPRTVRCADGHRAGGRKAGAHRVACAPLRRRTLLDHANRQSCRT